MSIRGELTAKIDAVESRLDSKISVLGNKMNAFDAKIGSGFSALGAQLENAVLRGELSTTREIADLRIRVERLEGERGQYPNSSQLPNKSFTCSPGRRKAKND